MNERLARFVHRAFRKLKYFEQFLHFLSWARKEYDVEGFSVYIAIEGFEKEFNLRKKTHKKKSGPNFVFCRRGGLTEVHTKINQMDTSRKLSDWLLIYNSYQLEIWENKNTHTISPLRFGMTEEEKLQAFKIVRDSARFFLENNEIPSSDIRYPQLSPNNRFLQNATVCVAVWVQGTIRGSVIMEDNNLFDALIEGGKRVCIDGRFKPITKEELEYGQIEITIISELKLPISKKDLVANIIDPHVGYLIKSETKKGWYMPEMFNCAKFDSLSSLIYSLGSRKARLTQNEFKESIVYTFKVHDFIESLEKKYVFKIDGSVPRLQNSYLEDQIPTTLLINSGTLAFKQLHINQEHDGNIPPIFNPLTYKSTQVGWPQLACTIWAMAEFARSTSNVDFLNASHKGFDYLKGQILREGLLAKRRLIATLPYMIQASNILEKKDSTIHLLGVLDKLTDEIDFYHPILIANLASVFAHEDFYNKERMAKAIHYAGLVYADFQKSLAHSKSISLAENIEIVRTFLYLSKITDNNKFMQKANDMIAWYTSFQLNSGAFPNTSIGSPAPYTRGTGKIFEIMSLFPSNKEDTVHKTFLWLFHMQYTTESMYFIKPEFRNLVLGGLRHDYLNHELWIDGSAHFLLGISRLLSYREKSDSPRSHMLKSS